MCSRRICQYFVEFGFNGLAGSNTAQLSSVGWTGLRMDGGNADPTLNLFKEFITPANVCGLFAKHGVPKGFDYLSIDLDTTDIWVFRAIMELDAQKKDSEAIR